MESSALSAAAEGRRPRIAVTFPGDPTDPSTWSGSPSRICASLEGLGAEVVPVSVLPPVFVQRWAGDAIALTQLHRSSGHWRARVAHARGVAGVHPIMGAIHGLVCARRLRVAGHLDGVVQIGTGYAVEHPNTVTYEDMTCPQAREVGLAHLHALSRRAFARRLAGQQAAYRRARRVLFATAWAAESAVVDMGADPGKVDTVGIGRNYTPSFNASRSWRTPTFLFVGRLWEQKGGPTLLAAFERVRRVRPDARLVVVGGHPEQLPEGVHGVGHLSLGVDGSVLTMDELWSRATCCVVPADFEAAGMVFAEAAAAGVPSIGSALGGAASLIGPGGCVVPPRDVDALAEAMLAYCDPARAREVGEAAHRRAGSFEWHAVAERMLAHLGCSAFPSPRRSVTAGHVETARVRG